MDFHHSVGPHQQRIQLGSHRIGVGWVVLLVEAAKEVQQPRRARGLHHVTLFMEPCRTTFR